MLKMMLFLVILACCTLTIIAGGGCWSSGYGGCNDGGCFLSGGYCQNFGRPPNNDCRCSFRGK